MDQPDTTQETDDVASTGTSSMSEIEDNMTTEETMNTEEQTTMNTGDTMTTEVVEDIFVHSTMGMTLNTPGLGDNEEMDNGMRKLAVT